MNPKSFIEHLKTTSSVFSKNTSVTVRVECTTEYKVMHCCNHITLISIAVM